MEAFSLFDGAAIPSPVDLNVQDGIEAGNGQLNGTASKESLIATFYFKENLKQGPTCFEFSEMSESETPDYL